MNAFNKALEAAQNIATEQIALGRFAQVDEVDGFNFILWFALKEEEGGCMDGLAFQDSQEYPGCIRVVRVNEICYPLDDGRLEEGEEFDADWHITSFIDDIEREGR